MVTVSPPHMVASAAIIFAVVLLFVPLALARAEVATKTYHVNAVSSPEALCTPPMVLILSVYIPPYASMPGSECDA